jgi:hypothetical protein
MQTKINKIITRIKGIFLISFVVLFFHISFLKVSLLKNSAFLDIWTAQYYTYTSLVLALVFLFIINKNSILSIVLLIITAILFSIDRYFSVLSQDLIFSTGLTLNNIAFLSNDFEMIYNIIIDYINIDMFLTFFKYLISFFLICSISNYFLKKIIINYDLKPIDKVNQYLLLTLFFVFILFSFEKDNETLDTSFTFRSFYTAIYTMEILFNDDRQDIYITEINKTDINNIIFIVDESIQYEYFNHEKLDFKHINLSPSLAVFNCSFTSNKSMITGAVDKDLPLPSLFQYAKNSNFKTFLINTQSNTLTNGLNYNDEKFIDEFVYIGKNTKTRDNRAVNKIVNILKSNILEKKFIFVQKYGAHFNYINSIVPNIEKKDSNAIVREEHYKQSIQENSIEFLNKLEKHIDKSTVIFYISDHGQNLNFIQDKKGEEMALSHCDGNLYSYRVPSLIIGNTKCIKNKIDKFKKYYYSLDLFGLSLLSMGYKEEDILKYYKINTKLKDMKMVDVSGEKEINIKQFYKFIKVEKE